MKYIVTGLGRCGSSLVMQMLEAAGIAVTGEYPAFEHDAGNELGFDRQWLSDAADGTALKVLDLQLDSIQLPTGDYKTIVLKRDRAHQARSHAKFLRYMCGIQISRQERRNIQRSFGSDFRKLLHKANAINGACLVLSFDEIFWKPEHSCRQIANYLELPDSTIEKMFSVIVPRTPKARPDMALERSLIRQRKMLA